MSPGTQDRVILTAVCRIDRDAAPSTSLFKLIADLRTRRLLLVATSCGPLWSLTNHILFVGSDRRYPVATRTRTGRELATGSRNSFVSRDYEECRLLGYKNPVRTSQETHYISTTESSQLMLCKI
jgi:hypothetical protein